MTAQECVECVIKVHEHGWFKCGYENSQVWL